MTDLKTTENEIDRQLCLLDSIPEELYKCSPKDLSNILKKPTLIKINGQTDDYLFISVLLHGNETSGFFALQRLINNYKYIKFPRSIALFIGNVRAAKKELRKLDSQLDFNRIWRDDQKLDGFEYQFVNELKNELKKTKLFAAIDIHNTSGDNPDHACISNFNHHSYLIAQNFSDFVINLINDTTLCQYTSKLCPSVILECGLPSSRNGINSAYHLVNKLLNVNDLDQLMDNSNARVYFTCATIKINPKTTIEFSNQPLIEKNAQLLIREDIESFNFKMIELGEILAHSQNNQSALQEAIEVRDNQQNLLTHQYFEMDGNQIKVKTPFIPCMLTTVPQIAKDDCLGYIIKALSLESDIQLNLLQ